MMDDNFRQPETTLRSYDTGADVTSVVDSVTLARLMAEVRNDGEARPTAYNRMHNRHNRS